MTSGRTGERTMRVVRADSAVARELDDLVQAEYVVRYGGKDETPTEPAEFDPPAGAFVVTFIAARPVASGGFRRRDARTAEIKRMFVVAGERGRGHARAVLAELERLARSAGYTRMVLETGLLQPEAMTLYRSSGYTEVEPFGHHRDSPLSRCFGRDL